MQYSSRHSYLKKNPTLVQSDYGGGVTCKASDDEYEEVKHEKMRQNTDGNLVVLILLVTLINALPLLSILINGVASHI